MIFFAGAGIEMGTQRPNGVEVRANFNLSISFVSTPYVERRIFVSALFWSLGGSSCYVQRKPITLVHLRGRPSWSSSWSRARP